MTTCPDCEKPLSPDVPDGLCPQCLLLGALEPRGGFDDYELLEEIARGGMGIVYRAHQISLNRVVAVKTILAGQLAGDEAVQRFHKEAEAAASLQHPNIVSIHQVGEQDGLHFFSMDYVDGRDLGQLTRSGPLDPERAARYVKTIAEAVHFAHQRGTLHRDLKPQNILIDANDQPRITDFGLARRIDGDNTITRTGAVMGSPSYMPPEQAAGRHDLLGPQSDVYSLGAVLYELLTGRAPFEAETPVATLREVMEVEPVPPSTLTPSVPRDLETVCLKCLEKRPERRYASARELAEELGRFLSHEPILARSAGPLRKLWSWGKRNPWLLAGGVSLLFLALVGLAGWLWMQDVYLSWVIDHPGYLRKPGVLAQELQAWKIWLVIAGPSTFVASLALILSYGLRKQKRGSSVARLALGIVGAAGIIFAAALVLKGVQALVWEGYHLVQMASFVSALFVYLVYWLGPSFYMSRFKSEIYKKGPVRLIDHLSLSEKVGGVAFAVIMLNIPTEILSTSLVMLLGMALFNIWLSIPSNWTRFGLGDPPAATKQK